MSKEKLIELWNQVADGFSNSGATYWDEFGTRLVELSNIKHGDIILDIGTGRGSSLFPAAIHSGNNGMVTGIDISSEMVRLTNDRINKLKITNAKVMQMDAEQMDFDNESFDKIIAGFSIGNIVGTETGLNELNRILKSNGQLCFSSWGGRTNQKWLDDIVGKYLEIKAPATTNAIKFSDIDSIINVISPYGFNCAMSKDEIVEVKYRDKDAWWNEMNSNAFRNIINAVSQKGEKELQCFKHEVYEGLNQLYKDDIISIEMNVLYFVFNKN